MKGHPFEYDRDAAAMDLSEYIRLPFTQFAQEEIGAYANPVAMWNAKVWSHRDRCRLFRPVTRVVLPMLWDVRRLHAPRQVKSYLNVSSHAKIIIRHEDLFDLETLSSKLMKLTEHGFLLRPGTSSISYPPLLPSGANLIEKSQFTVADFDGAKAYSQSQQSWASRFSQRDLHFISAQLDGSVLAACNYTFETAAPSLQSRDDEVDFGGYIDIAGYITEQGTKPSTNSKSMLLKAERHTGSHFLASILRRNFPKSTTQQVHGEPIMHSSDCPVEQPQAANSSCCWKHGLADTSCRYVATPAGYVFLVRHPYSWLLAMKANPYEYDGYWLQASNHGGRQRPSLQPAPAHTRLLTHTLPLHTEQEHEPRNHDIFRVHSTALSNTRAWDSRRKRRPWRRRTGGHVSRQGGAGQSHCDRRIPKPHPNVERKGGVLRKPQRV